MGKLIHVKSIQEFNDIIANSVAVVDFYADWCGPCKMIAPTFEKLSDTYETVKFLKVNVDEAEELAAQAGISAMPTFQVYKDGKKFDELVGASVEKLESLIKKYA